MAPPEIDDEIPLQEIGSFSAANNTNGMESISFDNSAPMGLYKEKKGMYVTARNLSMAVGSEKKGDRRNILSDLNFFLKPGSMVLILGSPGCGKTSVMKALANQLHSETVTGSLLFNGKVANDDTHHRDVAYVVQGDHHMAPFTVRETFKFSADLQMSEGTSEEEKVKRVDYILETLDLVRQQDTVVGNEFLRGVSGGQKKRVTIGVEMVKDAGLFLMDEPSTGLDSTTTLELMKHFRDLSNVNQVSSLVALLQPGVEVTKLFDFLMVLNAGHMVYFGPMSDAISYFEGLGFKLPKHHNPAEFFQEIVDEPELYFEGEGEPPLRGAEEFANAYKNSAMFNSIINDLDNNTPDLSFCKDSSHLPKYPTPLSYQIHLASIRAFKMLISSQVAVRMRIIKSVVMGLILGSLFYGLDLNQTDGSNRSGLIFFSLLFIVFSGMGAIAILFEQREVFYIQKDGKYYKTFAFFLSLIFSEIPIALLETVVFCVLVYWMCGLQANAEKFIYFLLMNFIGDLAFQSFFKMVSAFASNATLASVIAPAALAPFILFSGFMAPKSSIGGWWIWIYWISPIKYAFEGLMSNEHHGLHYGCDASETIPPTNNDEYLKPFPNGTGGKFTCQYQNGDDFLDQLGMPQNNWFKWIDLLIVFAFGVLFSLGMYFFLKNVHIDHRASDPKNEKRIKKASKKSRKIKESKVDMGENNIKKAQKEVPIGCYMQWKDLVYEVDVKKDGKKQRLRLLSEINGYVKPGMLLALMGPSGAGKSTLLDVLANRKTGGHTKGQILINGQERTKYFTRLSAYVEQFDVLPPTQTVKESITFSAKTRLPAEMPMEEKIKFVDNILETLNLVKIQNKEIGHGEQGLSLSQRKRVNIGIELASDPQLLFLDEPTSGLDSSAALKVMNLIKKIASSGRSIICTIHQPSTSIFKQFDHLLLLKRGGETVYFGPTGDKSVDLLGYFENHGLICDPLKNPADFILDVTDDVIETTIDGKPHQFHPVQQFKESQLNNNLLEKIEAGIMPVGTPVPEFHGIYSSTYQTQFVELGKRSWFAQVRRVQNIRTRLMRSLFLGVVLGTLFVRMETTQENIYNRVSILFFSLMFGGMSGMSSIPIVNMERGVFYREQASGMYSIPIYLFTFIVTDLPWVFASAIIYTIPMYFISGLRLDPNGAPFFYHSFISFTTYFNFSMLAMVFATVLPTDEIAHALGGVALSISSLFAGFMIPPASIAKGWHWFYQLDPTSYPLSIVMVNEFKNLEFSCNNDEYVIVPDVSYPNGTTFDLKICPVQNGNQILDRYEMKEEDEYKFLAVIFGYSVFFFICIFIALKFIRHQTK